MKITCTAVMTMVFLFSAGSFVHAQEDTQAPQSNEEIAKKLANPNTVLGQMAFPFDYIAYQGNLPGANQQDGFLMNFQPSLPVPLGEGLNLYIRPLIPLYLSQPVFGENGFEQKGINLGNISADVAIGKTWPSKTITIAGVFAGFRTASDEALRSDFTTLGPELMVAQLTNWGVFGLLIDHAWSLNQVNGESASITAGQYFLTINIKNGWQVFSQPTWSYNHKAEKGDRFTLPVGPGIIKVVTMGKTPIKLSLQYWYYVATPDTFGPQHQIRFQISPVVPLPW